MSRVRWMVLVALIATAVAACSGGTASTTTSSALEETTTTEAATTTLADTTTTTSPSPTTTEPNPFTEALAGTRHGTPQVAFHGGNPFILVISASGSASFTLDRPGGASWVGEIRNTTADTLDVFVINRDIFLWPCDQGDNEETYGYTLQGGTLRFVDLGDECEARRDFLTTTAWSEQ